MSRDDEASHVFILERQRRELLSINQKWAKEYNNMVAYYQRKLLTLQASPKHPENVTKETKSLSKHLPEALESRLPSGTLKERETTPSDLWRHQAEVFKEDFAKERRDREELQHKYEELSKKLVSTRNELHHLKSQATWTRILHPVVECTCQRTDQRNTGF
ncbi:TNFAIP3-interacting protein 3-like [Corythoichthys intestinalis]|uniref:TNFAIP3-interacting protein 3-like n=1 Tax=Corythoichthys intestinalis TaxID=161448 RepID=UPI0025A5228D|nr:TNFAIP3-interacting protein 3-like [Corythoichthys intestinalis]